MNRVLTLACAALIAAFALAIPFIAPAQPTPVWSGDVCHQPATSQITCERYPRRVQAHLHNCKWVQEVGPAGPHDFEVCHSHDGLWRPSGRS